jgi:transcription-repair coupling factor (superfamily II helicase)
MRGFRCPGPARFARRASANRHLNPEPPSLSSPLPPLPLPATGERLQWPSFAGSADALLLAQAANAARSRARGGLLAVITSSASDAQRLLQEIPWFDGGLRVRLLPDWETLPYDGFSPHLDLVSERLATLYAVTRGECDVLLLPAGTAVCRLAPPAYLAAYTFFLKQGERLDGERFRAQMTLAGYAHVTQVVAPGEYSIRGGLIDLFPMGAQLPFRLDLFDDEIEHIKTFDVDSQRTLYPVAEVRLLPAREFPLDGAARSRFRQRFREAFEGDPARSSIYRDVSNGVASAGIEYWLPLFFDATATLFDYLPPSTLLCLHNDVAEAVRAFWREAQSRYTLLAGERSRPLLPPDELFLAEEPFFVAARAYARLSLRAGGDGPARRLPELAIDRRADDPLRRLKTFLDGFPGRSLLLAESAGRRETLAALLADYGLQPRACGSFDELRAGEAALSLGVGPLHDGFLLDGLAIITEAELYAGSPSRRARHVAARRTSIDNWLRDLTELKVGSPVVHEQHGIGRYQGLVHLDLGEGDTEFLELHYANDARLYVPVSQLHVIARYSRRWTACSAATSASARPRWRCAPRSASPPPAARSPCCARRRSSPSSTRTRSRSAASRSASASRCCRATAPAANGARSSSSCRRARSTSSSAPTQLLGKDVQFADLGLVIVDEEQRFGVRQKERLKQLRAEVDVLTLSATPIPRTLQRQHDPHQPCREVRAGATAPAARSRRTFTPPGLCLPADARRRGAQQAGEATPRGDPDDGRTRCRLLPGDA